MTWQIRMSERAKRARIYAYALGTVVCNFFWTISFWKFSDILKTSEMVNGHFHHKSFPTFTVSNSDIHASLVQQYYELVMLRLVPTSERTLRFGANHSIRKHYRTLLPVTGLCMGWFMTVRKVSQVRSAVWFDFYMVFFGTIY